MIRVEDNNSGLQIKRISNTKNIGAEYYINKRQQVVINNLIVCGENILTHIENSISPDILASLLHEFIDVLNQEKQKAENMRSIRETRNPKTNQLGFQRCQELNRPI